DCFQKKLAVAQRAPGVMQAALSDVDADFDQPARGTPLLRSVGGEKIGDGYLTTVGPGFMQLIGAKLLAGRLFDPDNASETAIFNSYASRNPLQPDVVHVVISRAALPILGAATPQEAIGKQFVIGRQDSWKPRAEVIGVVEDWHQRSLRYSVNPL